MPKKIESHKNNDLINLKKTKLSDSVANLIKYGGMVGFIRMEAKISGKDKHNRAK